MVDKYANVLSLQIIAMWMTNIRETNRRKTRRPPSGVCSRDFRYTRYLCTFTQKLHPLPQIINFLRQRSTLLALHYCWTVSLEPYTLFSVFLHLAVYFELSAFERGCDIGCGNEQDTHAVEMEVNKGTVYNGG